MKAQTEANIYILSFDSVCVFPTFSQQPNTTGYGPIKRMHHITIKNENWSKRSTGFVGTYNLQKRQRKWSREETH